MIVELTDVLSFLNVGVGYFVVDASHDKLILTYNSESASNILLTDGTYNGTELATHLKAKIDTAFGNSSTVEYSTDTKKFTITVAGNLITYTNTGSDAGLLFGFNQNHAAAESITSDVAASDPSAIISDIHSSVEDWVQNHCYRIFEDALYVKERHDGNEHSIIYFDQYPVLAVNLDGLDWTADKKVTRSDGGSFITDGFEAGDKVLVQNSDSNSGLLTIATSGVAALVLTFTDTITADTSDNNVILSLFRELWINDTKVDEDEYEVFSDHIYYDAGFSEANVRTTVRMTYKIKYAIVNMKDLKFAIKVIVKSMYQKRQEEIFGTKEYWVGDVKIICEDSDIPREALNILEKYEKAFIV